MREGNISRILREIFPEDYPGSEEFMSWLWMQEAIHDEPRWSNYGGWIN